MVPSEVRFVERCHRDDFITRILIVLRRHVYEFGPSFGISFIPRVNMRMVGSSVMSFDVRFDPFQHGDTCFYGVFLIWMEVSIRQGIGGWNEVLTTSRFSLSMKAALRRRLFSSNQAMSAPHSTFPWTSPFPTGGTGRRGLPWVEAPDCCLN